MSTASASLCIVSVGVIGVEPSASVAMISTESPSGNDSTCSPISAAPIGSSIRRPENPSRRTPEPTAPERLSTLASALATNARRSTSRAGIASPSQRAMTTSIKPVNATATSASNAMPSAGRVGTASRVRCISGRSNSSMPCTSSQPTRTRNAIGTSQRRREVQPRATGGLELAAVSVVIAGEISCGWRPARSGC